MSLTLTMTAPKTQPISANELAESIRHLSDSDVIAKYHAIWYHAKHTWPMTRYRDIPTLKAPNDLQIYHEILWRLKPGLVIETGSCFGGSALWFADQLEPWGGRVISIDTVHPDDCAAAMGQKRTWPAIRHPRVEFVTGSSTDDDVVEQARQACEGVHCVMVSLDSDHSKAHVTRELELYAPFVTPVGSYLVVEDTNVSGRPLTADDPGPGAAVDAWLGSGAPFQANILCERYLMTFHPGGWLVRIR